LLIVDGQYPQGIAALDHVHSLGAETSAHLYCAPCRSTIYIKIKKRWLYYEKFLAASQARVPTRSSRRGSGAHFAEGNGQAMIWRFYCAVG